MGFSNYQDIVIAIKSTITANRNNLPIKKLDMEFRKFVGHSIPYNEFDYQCLRDFLKNIPGIKIVKTNTDDRLTVTSSKSSHVAKLVENQRDRRTPKKRVNFKNVQKPFNTQYKVRSNSVGRRSSSRDRRSDNGSDDFSSVSSKESRQSSISIVIDPYRKMKVVCDPIAYNQQLIGDDFFLQLAIRELHVNNLWRKHDKDAIRSGLCVSGQTIKDCVKRLKEISTISNRVVIMLGAVDIYKGDSFGQMIEDLNDLLEILENKFLMSKSAITLCTIPPLANIPHFSNFEKMSAHYGFNNYIRYLTQEGYGCIDFFTEFLEIDPLNDQYKIDFDLFQVEARMVSGCPEPHVLWNKKGRTKAMQLLKDASMHRGRFY